MDAERDDAYLVEMFGDGETDFDPRDYEPAVCDNCGRDEHTPAELAACLASMIDPRRSCIVCGVRFDPAEGGVGFAAGGPACVDCVDGQGEQDRQAREWAP